MKGKIQVLFIILSQIFFHHGIAQNNGLKFNLVEGPNGKSLGGVRNMTQDPYGYMWFAAQGAKCIYRYDGNRYTIFRHDDANPNSLGGVNINSVYADNKGIIWIGMSEGLDRYDPVTGIFKHYRHIANDPNSPTASPGIAPVLKDRKGRVWVGTENGLDRLDEKTGKFFHYRNEPGNPKSLSSNIVWYIYEDRQGVIWIATGFPWFHKDPEDGGLNRLNADGSFTRYKHDSSDPHSLINNKVATMFEDSRGNFWVGTGGDGLHIMDRKTGRFERLPYDPKKPDQLSRPPLKPGEENDKISFIIEDTMGAIWIGTMYSGMNRYDTGTKKITPYENSHGFPDSTSWNAFTSRDGELWITTEHDNLFRVDPFHKSIDSILTSGTVPMNFMEDRQGNLWVGTLGKGLLEFDQHYKLINQFKHDSLNRNSLVSNNVMGLFQNQENIIWVGSDGLQLLNTITNQFSRFPDNGNLKDSTEKGIHIFQDKQGVFWFGRWGLGLIRYNPSDQTFKHFLSDEKDSTSLSANEIISVVEDRAGILWTAGPNGISRLDRQSGRFKRYLEGVWINKLYEDSGGNLWTVTQKGLFRYDPKEDGFSVFFDPQQEINYVSVGGMTEDNAKNLWLVSESGIIKLNPVSKEIFMYGNRFRIDPVLWAKAGRNRKGRIFIPGENCLYTFLPEELNFKTNFKIILTDFSINSQAVLPGKGSPVQIPVEEIIDLDLQYNQNNISFNFAAIDYRDPAFTRYFYMLEGFDKEWQEVKDKKEKSSYYFNLPQGKYIYRVKAFNSEGTKAEKTISIHINPPWWLTWQAFTGYAIILILSVWGFIRWRTRALQEEKIILERKVAKRTEELKKEKEIVESTLSELKMTQAQLIQSEKMASLGELTAGIAHEIQNPLNFVNNFSEVNMELTNELRSELSKIKMELTDKNLLEEIADNITQNEEKINHHGKRADAIVKGMLQHSRMTLGLKEPTDINQLADEYLRLAYHGLRAKDKSFNTAMKTELDQHIEKINIVPQDIGRVLLNLYNNAFYAVAEKKQQQGVSYEPTVELSTKKTGKIIEVTVRDNGNGMPKKVLEKIFQPFFTTKPAGQGTGLGLSLSFDVVKAHGGEIKVNTVENEGTEFIIRLPL